MKYLKLLRIHHYIKNLLIFIPLICNKSLFNTSLFTNCLIGFLSFSLISSSIYIINDICDIEKDKLNPTKKYRPIASGEISIKKAKTIAIFLFIISLILNIKFPSASIFIIIYFILNIGYSLKLKQIPIIDITIIAAGFLIRIIYGAAITNIKISPWLLLTTLTAALYLALGKRRNELRKNGYKTRDVLNLYTEEFLDKSLYMFLGLAITFYALWSMNTLSIYTTPLVMLITMKYNLNIDKNSDGDPVEVLLHDKLLISLCIIYVLLFITFLYL